MNWNKHFNLRDKHAFLSPSKVHWIRYDSEKLIHSYEKHRRAALGTKLHKFAEQAIILKQRLPDNRTTINAFVNDAIGYRLDPEVVLFVSENVFGTVDAIGFKDNVLRIHDLKTGTSPAKTEQLDIYCAMFCLEYEINPSNIKMILRIYQNDEVLEWFPEPLYVLELMETILRQDSLINEIRGD